MEFQHNFCESRLNNNNPPEILNSYSSLIISFIPYFFNHPHFDQLIHIKYLLIFNGIGSFIYHYYLNWLGKHLDEISMIMMNYYGLNFLLDIFLIKKFNNLSYDGILINTVKQANLYVMIILITINTFIKYDYLFPITFGIYILITVLFIILNGIIYKYNLIKIRNFLGISLIGAFFWILSELYCNNITMYGHVIWHLCFPLGFYKIINYIDQKIYKKYDLNNSNL